MTCQPSSKTENNNNFNLNLFQEANTNFMEAILRNFISELYFFKNHLKFLGQQSRLL